METLWHGEAAPGLTATSGRAGIQTSLWSDGVCGFKHCSIASWYINIYWKQAWYLALWMQWWTRQHKFIDLKSAKRKQFKISRQINIINAHSDAKSKGHLIYEVCPEKIQPLLIWQEWFAQHWCNLAAKESGLECACMNNDDILVLVSGGGRHRWVRMCTVWPLHSKWLSE